MVLAPEIDTEVTVTIHVVFAGVPQRSWRRGFRIFMAFAVKAATKRL